MQIKSSHRRWLLPVIGMLTITPLTPWLDMAIAQYYYDPVKETFSHHPFYQFMFYYGLVPALATLAGATLLLAFSWHPRWKRWRVPARAFIFTLTLGAGLVTHAILKDHWGRPRPRQITEFGGKYSFRPFYYPNFSPGSEPRRSFPCGHCTMGFTFFSIALIGQRRRNKILTYSGFTLAFALGTTLGIARLAQGGHFFSDVLIGALIMWLTALVIDWAVHPGS